MDEFDWLMPSIYNFAPKCTLWSESPSVLSFVPPPVLPCRPAKASATATAAATFSAAGASLSKGPLLRKQAKKESDICGCERVWVPLLGGRKERKWNRIGKEGGGVAATRQANYYCNLRASLRSVDDDDPHHHRDWYRRSRRVRVKLSLSSCALGQSEDRNRNCWSFEGEQEKKEETSPTLKLQRTLCRLSYKTNAFYRAIVCIYSSHTRFN